jgi:hypothetical protein
MSEIVAGTTMPCRSCGKTLLILNNDNTGKPGPVESDPVATGNIVRVGLDRYHVMSKAELALPPTADVKRYQSHYVTCPNAGGWRDREKPAE